MDSRADTFERGSGALSDGHVEAARLELDDRNLRR
jgi:hypothetical protein